MEPRARDGPKRYLIAHGSAARTRDRFYGFLQLFQTRVEVLFVIVVATSN